jgi:hypothetical protein
MALEGGSPVPRHQCVGPPSQACGSVLLSLAMPIRLYIGNGGMSVAAIRASQQPGLAAKGNVAQRLLGQVL